VFLIISFHLLIRETAQKNIKPLTLWRPLLPYRYSYKASCARPG